MCEQGMTLTVPVPDWYWAHNGGQDDVIALDACIASDILTAWKHGIYTESACCGHGTEPASLVLLDEDHIETAKHLLPGFRLHIWRLVDVTSPIEYAIRAIDLVMNEHANDIFNNDTTALLETRERLRNMQLCGLE